MWLKIGPGPELELAGLLVVDRQPRHVGRQQVGRELDAGKPQLQAARERLRQRRLARARHVLDQHVPLDQQSGQQQLDGVRPCR